MISQLISLGGFKSIYFFPPRTISISFRDSLLFGEQRKFREKLEIFSLNLLLFLGKEDTSTEDAFESQQFEISSDAKFVRFGFSGFQLN